MLMLVKVRDAQLPLSHSVYFVEPSTTDAPCSNLGDSGGPLLRQLPNSEEYEIVGIVSWGKQCGTSNYPGVYTRISAVASFVRDGICMLSANPPSDCPTSVPTSSPLSLPVVDVGIKDSECQAGPLLCFVLLVIRAVAAFLKVLA
jgi:hypothetical protein